MKRREKQNHFDAILRGFVWAPLLLGGDGVPAVAALNTGALTEMPQFERIGAEIIGEDGLAVFRARRPREGDARERK